MPSVEEQLAWAAGLFEGEGWFTIGHGVPQACIRSTDRDVIVRFCEIMGHGHVRMVDKGNPRYKKQWHWGITGFEKVRRFGDLIGPWLGDRRRKQLERVLKSPAPILIRAPKDQLELIRWEWTGGESDSVALGT